MKTRSTATTKPSAGSSAGAATSGVAKKTAKKTQKPTEPAKKVATKPARKPTPEADAEYIAPKADDEYIVTNERTVASNRRHRSTKVPERYGFGPGVKQRRQNDTGFGRRSENDFSNFKLVPKWQKLVRQPTPSLLLPAHFGVAETKKTKKPSAAHKRCKAANKPVAACKKDRPASKKRVRGTPSCEPRATVTSRAATTGVIKRIKKKNQWPTKLASKSVNKTASMVATKHVADATIANRKRVRSPVVRTAASDRPKRNQKAI
ncbi:hypothetical protein EDC01DRAFT_776366 [Geopyxis carbonaria]|nr:hypothetical protein EDC01DRAFT_776366 [Geopyxis carbonaria]